MPAANSQTPPPSPQPSPPPSMPPPLMGLHLSGDSAKVHFGPNMECTLELVPGPPAYLASNCPINAPPPAPSSPPPPPPPPSRPPSEPPPPPLFLYSAHRDDPGGTVLRYDPTTDSFVSHSSTLNTQCGAVSGATVLDDYMYVLGGWQVGANWASSNDNFKRLSLADFESAPAAWEDLTSPTYSYPGVTGTQGGMMAAFNGLVWVMGGRLFDGAVNKALFSSDVFAYDPSTSQFSTKASLNLGRQYFRTAVLDGFLYVLGGAGHGGTDMRTDTAEMYDPSKDQWTYIADIPSSDPGVIEGFGCVAYSGRIYIYAGQDATNSAWPNYYYSRSIHFYSPDSNTWTTLAATHNVPSDIVALTGFGYAVSGSQMYLFGGRYGAPGTGDTTWNYVTWYYDIEAGTWHQVGDMPSLVYLEYTVQ